MKEFAFIGYCVKFGFNLENYPHYSLHYILNYNEK